MKKQSKVAHEALITRWNRLRKWMELYREFRLWQERFRTRIHEWERSNYSQSELLRGVMLEESENWLLERSKELNQAEQKFIRVSREKQEWEKRRMESLKQISQISMAFPTAVKLSNLVEDVYQFVSNVFDVSPPKTQLSLNVLQFVNLALLIL